MFRILIVDDEKIVLNGIKLLIEKRMQLPFVPDIAIASSAAAALELLSVFQPDLILSDIRMPVIDGFAFIEQVKKRDIICDFAILTSHADFNYAKRAITLHVEDFILKPVETAELQQVLLNCHAKKEQRRKAEEKEGFSLLRNLLLYDLPIEQLISEEELFRSIFPYKYFPVLLLQTDSPDPDFTEIIEKELSFHYQKCHTFYFYQNRQYITVCNHDHFFIDTAPLKQIFRHILLNQSFRYSISISSNSWKELHNLYMNAQLRIFYQKIYPENQEMADISFITYWDCIKIFAETDELKLSQQMQQYIDKLLSQFTPSPRLFDEIYESFLSNCNFYLENLNAPLLQKTYSEQQLDTPEKLRGAILQNILSYRQFIQDSQKRGSEPDAVSTLISYIDHHYTEDISLENLADSVEMHPNYVCSLFKKQFGYSYLTYLHQKRIEHAKKLLVQTEFHTLDEIATLVGYNSSNQLLRIFKKYEHMTPGEYRKLQE